MKHLFLTLTVTFCWCCGPTYGPSYDDTWDHDVGEPRYGYHDFYTW